MADDGARTDAMSDAIRDAVPRERPRLKAWLRRHLPGPGAGAEPACARKRYAVQAPCRRLQAVRDDDVVSFSASTSIPKEMPRTSTGAKPASSS